MTLFENARAGDPVTSQLAGAELEMSGRGEAQRRRVLEVVDSLQGLTSREIAAILRCDRYTPSRRLPELRKDNLVKNGPRRICKRGGRLSQTWEITGKGRKVVRDRQVAEVEENVPERLFD